MNTTEFLTIATAICPEKEAIVFEGKRYTFTELSERVNRLTNALLELGVQKGDRVAMLQVNTNQCVEVYFAVAKAGAIYVPLNFRADLERTATRAETRFDLGNVFELYFLFSVCFKEGLARASLEPVRIETINTIELKNPIGRDRIFLARLGNSRAVDPKH